MRRVRTLKPQGLRLVESMRKQLASNNNQRCDFSHMTKRRVREGGLVWWLHEATEGPSTIYLPVQPPLTCDSRACLPVDNHFGILPPFQEGRREKGKGERHILADSAPLGKIFPTSAYISVAWLGSSSWSFLVGTKLANVLFFSL